MYTEVYGAGVRVNPVLYIQGNVEKVTTNMFAVQKRLQTFAFNSVIIKQKSQF